MGQKRGSGGGSASPSVAVFGGGVRGSPDSAGRTVSSGLGTAVPVLGAWLKYGKYVVAPIARAIYGSGKKFKIGGQQVGRAAYQRYQTARRFNAMQAAATGAQYIPPTADEWRRRKEAVEAKRPRVVPPKQAPPPPPPPPPPRGPTGPRRTPGMGGPGSIRSQIFAYVVANGIVWGITKLGEWIREREATAEEVRTGRVAGRTMGGGPRRGRGPDMTGTDTWYEAGGLNREPLTPIQIFQKRLPVPKYTPPKPKAPKIQKQATPTSVLEPIVITAQRLPTPAPAPTIPTWLKLLGALPTDKNPLELFRGKKASKSQKQLGRALTALQTRGVTSTSTQSSFSSSFSGFSGGTPTRTKKCKCPPKRKKKPKQPRTVCYTGTFTERADGLTKLKRRKVPCRLSSASRRSPRIAR